MYRISFLVSVKSNSLEGFKGFLCQARRDAKEYVTYGTLTPAGNVNMVNNCGQVKFTLPNDFEHE